MATGRIGATQAAALGLLLAEAGREGLFRVVLIHHPVAEHAATRMRRLIDAARFRKAIAEHGAELVLHGHNHRTSVMAVPGPLGAVPVVGATATSLQVRARTMPAAATISSRSTGRRAPGPSNCASAR